MRDVKNKTRSSRSSLRLLGIFCALVFVAVLISLGYRLFTLMSDSKFDGKHSFVVAFTHNKDVDLVSINPSQKTFSHLQVRGGKTVGENLRESGVLRDSSMALPSQFNLSDISRYFQEAALNQGGLHSDLNIYDLYRLSFVTKNLSSDSITSESVHVPFDQSGSNSLLEQLFLDDAIDQENKTVAIINGTGVPGLGTRLEQPLAAMGVSVISVTNSDSVKSTSQISYAGEKSYTLKRLASLLNLPTKPSDTQGISDIIILIGKDRIQTDQF